MVVEALRQTELHLIPALQPPGWEIMPAIEFYTKTDFCFPIKVVHDHKIIGIGTTIVHQEVAWLAHIIVDPDYRNQGIGRLITQTLIKKADNEGCETIYLLATEMGEPLYTKLGFEAETEYLSFKGEKIAGPPSENENIVPYKRDYKHQIAIIDLLVSGEDRMNHLEQYLTAGFVYQKDDNTLGYYLPSFGDGLVIAMTGTAGQALMRLRLAAKDFAVFPKENEQAVATMGELHFTAFRAQKRMRLGKKRDWQPANIYNRIGGNLG